MRQVLEPVLLKPPTETLHLFSCCADFRNFSPPLHQGPVMPGSHSVERYVIEENLHCIIKTHWKERKTW